MQSFENGDRQDDHEEDPFSSLVLPNVPGHAMNSPETHTHTHSAFDSIRVEGFSLAQEGGLGTDLQRLHRRCIV